MHFDSHIFIHSLKYQFSFHAYCIVELAIDQLVKNHEAKVESKMNDIDSTLKKSIPYHTCSTVGPCTMLPLGHQRCRIVQISVVKV